MLKRFWRRLFDLGPCDTVAKVKFNQFWYGRLGMPSGTGFGG